LIAKVIKLRLSVWHPVALICSHYGIEALFIDAGSSHWQTLSLKAYPAGHAAVALMAISSCRSASAIFFAC
jgi:hypothetical protein